MFSKRNGYITDKLLQLNSLDEDSRRAIWDIFYIFTKGTSQEYYNIARRISCSKYGFNISHQDFEEANKAFRSYDAYGDQNYDLEAFTNMLKQFIFSEEWNRVFDIIELYVNENEKIAEDLIKYFNKIFERESIGYRLTAEGEILSIVDTHELEEVNQIITLPQLSKNHFLNAISEFSKRKDMNYKLVARESIDGLEALLRDILGDEKIILGKAINKIQSDPKYSKYSLFFDGLDKIWAFANDQLRHAEKSEESIIGFYDAKFILVLASSIANYINSLR